MDIFPQTGESLRARTSHSGRNQKGHFGNDGAETRAASPVTKTADTLRIGCFAQATFRRPVSWKENGKSCEVRSIWSTLNAPGRGVRLTRAVPRG